MPPPARSPRDSRTPTPPDSLSPTHCSRSTSQATSHCPSTRTAGWQTSSPSSRSPRRSWFLPAAHSSACRSGNTYSRSCSSSPRSTRSSALPAASTSTASSTAAPASIRARPCGLLAGLDPRDGARSPRSCPHAVRCPPRWRTTVAMRLSVAMSLRATPHSIPGTLRQEVVIDGQHRLVTDGPVSRW